MLSEELRRRALDAVAHERAVFRAAVGGTLEQVRALVAASVVHNGQAERARAELGVFAGAHIDAARFAGVFEAPDGLRGGQIAQIRYAQHLLSATLTLEDEAFFITVEPGTELRAAVADALGTLGRAFAAAHMIAAVRDGRHQGDPLPLLASYPPDRWNRAERTIAPPLVIELQGTDLRVGGLEEVLHGAQKLVLLVEGDCPPAALVRLLTPGVFVLQTTDPVELAQLATVPGPGIAALLPENAARFVHEPKRHGRARLAVQYLPPEHRRALGRIGAFQQAEEVRWLQQLAADARAASERIAAEPETDQAKTEPGDRLAAYLLRQTKLDTVDT